MVSVTLRKVMRKDIWLIYRWRNDPRVRRMMFSSKPIGKEVHWAFWGKRLSSGKGLSFIAMAGKKPSGLLRLDKKARYHEVDILVAPSMQGRGIGTAALSRLAIKAKACGIKKLGARIKSGNVASMNVFEQNDFRRIGKGNGYVVYGRDL